MAQEGAYFVGSPGREDVFELAGLLLDFRFAVHCQAVGEQAFGKAVTPDNAAGALASAGGELHDVTAVSHRAADGLQGFVAGVSKRPMIVSLRRMGSG